MASPAGEEVRRRGPELYAEWKALGALLAEAARRSDRPAADSILLSDSGRGRTVLELLAEREGAVPRSVIRERLGLSESHLSHLLRDLEEADLIERIPAGREVRVALGRVGREVVERTVLPAWLDYVLDHLQRTDSGAQYVFGFLQQTDSAVHTVAVCESELLRRGAPSRIAAHRIAQALAGVAWLKQEVTTASGGGSTTTAEREQSSAGELVWAGTEP
ncbi:MAG: helix-turn-helix transcriptional regulator [Vicinamibacterales bacterium]